MWHHIPEDLTRIFTTLAPTCNLISFLVFLYIQLNPSPIFYTFRLLYLLYKENRLLVMSMSCLHVPACFYRPRSNE